MVTDSVVMTPIVNVRGNSPDEAFNRPFSEEDLIVDRSTLIP